jgi:hypothetical protein
MENKSLTIATPAEPDPFTTIRTVSISLFTNLREFTKPAAVTIAVPC